MDDFPAFPPVLASNANAESNESAMAGLLYQTEVRMGPRSGTDEKPLSNS